MAELTALDPKALAAARHAEFEEWQAGRLRQVVSPDPLVAAIRAYLAALDEFEVSGPGREDG